MNNAIAYSGQILLLVAGGALLPLLFRLKLPAARLWFWQGLLAACLLLPFVQPREISQISFTVADGPFQPGTPLQMTPATRLPIVETMVALYAAGVALRAIWLLLGCWRLRKFRRNATEIYPMSPTLVDAQKRLATFPDILLSTDISSPVTFGVWSPVILLPPSFLAMDEASQEAIMVHELMHVRRGDWIFSICEEVIRSTFWFHPAIWWLLAQIQLTREQVVDRATVEFTRARDQYLEALLAVAQTKLRPDLALAPLFLKKRHLARRVAAVMQEVTMSRSRIIGSLATAFALALVVGRVAVFVFPLEASAQEAADGIPMGVSVNTAGRTLLGGAGVEYPPAARQKNVEGTVFLDVNIDGKGHVIDARIHGGPEELRNSTLSSALRWRFKNPTGQPETVQASVTFRKGILSRPSTVKAVQIAVPDALVMAVRSRMPLRAGDQITASSIARTNDGLHEIDPRISLRLIPDLTDNSTTIQVGMTAEPPTIQPSDPPPPPGVKRIRVGGNVQASKLVEQPRPLYPPMAKQARIQGVVRFNVLVGREGGVQRMSLVSGHPLLVTMAQDAVRKWRYKPTLLNGEPVEVQTVVDVNFTLLQQ